MRRSYVILVFGDPGARQHEVWYGNGQIRISDSSVIDRLAPLTTQPVEEVRDMLAELPLRCIDWPITYAVDGCEDVVFVIFPPPGYASAGISLRTLVDKHQDVKGIYEDQS